MSEKSNSKISNRVLLIDDEPYIIEILSQEMKERGIECLRASNGLMALSLIEKEKPAVIVSDYKMPGLNGIELLQHLRNLQINIPVIWITGNADEQVMSEAWKLGIYHLFQKPFDPEEVANEAFSALNIDPELWARLQPKLITEAYIDKHVQKLQVELDKEVYQKLKEKCVNKSVSINLFINNLLREAVK